MPAVTFNVLASKIAGAGATSCDGQAAESVAETAQLVTGALLVASSLYIVVSNSAHHFQVYRSTDDGVSWTAYGAAFTPTARGGGMCVFADGALLIVSYTAALVAFSEIVYLLPFDTVLGTWGAEDPVNVLTITGGDASITRPEGPYAGYVRPGGSYAILVGGTVGNPDVWALIYDAGLWTAAARFTTSGVGSQYSSSCMAPDGTVHAFYVSDTHTRGYHQILHPDNTVSAKTALPTGLLDWLDTGVNWGFVDGATIYLAVGKATGETGIFGRAAIVWGNDAGWNLSLVLDTSPDVADYSVYSAMLLKYNGELLYVVRLVSSAGTNYLIRAGFVSSGGFNVPGAWTWTTLYDFSSPSPAFSGEAGPYTPITGGGGNSSMTLASDGVFRYVTTLHGTDQFVGLLFTSTVALAGNSFRCARTYF